MTSHEPNVVDMSHTIKITLDNTLELSTNHNHTSLTSEQSYGKPPSEVMHDHDTQMKTSGQQHHKSCI